MIFFKELPLLLCIVSLVCSLLCIYVYMKRKPPYPDMNHAISVMAIVKTIQKLCPLGPLNQWHLLPVGSGFPRCWYRSFPMKILDENIKVYGGSVLVKTPALHVIKMITDTDYWSYWVPLVPEHLETLPFDDPLFKGDGFMQVVKIVHKCNNNCTYMFSHLSKDNLGWILFWNSQTISLSFFLIQPLIEDESQCLLTCILGCYSKSCQKTIAERLIYNINSIKDATEISSAYKTKLNTSSIENSSEALMLLPYMQPSISFIKRLKFFELTVHSSKDNHDPSSTSPRRMKKKKLQGRTCNDQTFRKQNVHTSFKKIVPRPEIFIPTSGNSVPENMMSTKLNETLDGYHNSPVEVDNRHPPYEDDEIGRYNADKEEKLCDTDLKSDVVYFDSTSEFEMLLPDLPISSRRLADIKTRGNYCASELQLEILAASSVDFLESIGRPHSLGDWVFRGNIKGIAVCSKLCVSGSLKILSFMCRTNILVKQEDVWRFIKNPHCRFMCDESVKKVRVLEEISADQKIVYVCCEIGILKKENIDFCLLHTERLEQSIYYLAFYSTEYENCPLMDSVTRGTLLPSGFVIHAGSSEHANSTEVKYLYQILIDNSNSSFLQELDTCVASFLRNLKTYLLTKPF